MFFNKTGISRDFCYVFRTMLVALLVIFTENFAFASCPAGKIEYIENGSSVCSENKFQITTIPNTREMKFQFFAAGTYYVDCDTYSDSDEVTKIEISDAEMTTGKIVTCSYDIPGEYTIGFGGEAENYVAGEIVSSPDWYSAGANNCKTWTVFKVGTMASGGSSYAKNVKSISGQLGRIFPTISDKPQPSFNSTFSSTTNLTSIPGDLFKGIYGAPGKCMFVSTFSSTGAKNIPIGLFADIHGTSEGLFMHTFSYSQISSIDLGVFRTIKGPARVGMFANMFMTTRQLTSIPENLFGGITKDPAISSVGMFKDIFRGSKITKLPNKMFDDYHGKPETASFKNMFVDNPITGYIPYSLLQNLDATGYNAYGNTTPLDSMVYGTSLSYSCPKNLYKIITGFEGDLDKSSSSSVATKPFAVCAHCPDGGTCPAGSVGVESCTPADVICDGGTYLHGSSCLTCPNAYPNSERGSLQITDCYANLTYVFNNGDENLVDTFYYSSANTDGYVAKLPEPSRLDYVFVGWYDDTTLINQGDVLSGNKTLYAQWTQIKCNPGNYLAQNGLSCLSCPTAYPNSIFDSKNIYNCFATVTFYPNNDSDNTKENFYYTDANAQGYKIDKTPVTNTQYEFIGWFDNSGFSGTPITSSTVLSGNKNLYAQYGYLIEYDLDGGHLAYNKTNPSGYTTTDSPFTLNNPSKTGYSFAGWCKGNKTCSNAQTVMIVDPATLSGNQKFYATWTPETYSIRYQDGDTQITTVQTPTQYTFSETNQTFTPTPEPTKRAYKFIGWSTSNSDQTNYSKTISVPANTTGTKTFYAVWEMIGYDIHYETNGGQNNPENPQIYTISELPLELKPATKTGYIFNGWFDNSGLNGEPLTEIQSNTTGEINLYAKWTPITYNVVFNSNGGAGYKSGIVCTYDSYCDISNNEFEYDGHEYLGWDTNRKATTPTYIETTNGIKVMNLTSTNNETILLYAIWKEKMIELKYIYNNITSLDSCQYNNSFTTMTPPANAKPGFRFAGWVKE